MPKNTPSIEEQAENVQLNTFEEDIADAGAESPDEGHDTTKLALKPKKSRKNRSPAQVAAFEKMRAAKQQKDEAKRAAKKEDDALTEFVDSGGDDYEQIQSQRKKAREAEAMVAAADARQAQAALATRPRRPHTTLRRAVERGERTEECIRFDDRLSYAVPPRHTPPT